MAFENEKENTYQVEISGWDLDDNFFVERTDLLWGQNDRKMALLRRPVLEGALVFVRLTLPIEYRHSCPIAYHVANVNALADTSSWEVALTKVHPRNGTREAPGFELAAVGEGSSR
jgi:hypothetical protein